MPEEAGQTKRQTGVAHRRVRSHRRGWSAHGSPALGCAGRMGGWEGNMWLKMRA